MHSSLILDLNLHLQFVGSIMQVDRRQTHETTDILLIHSKHTRLYLHRKEVHSTYATAR